MKTALAPVSEPPASIKLFGTEETVPAVRILRAGRLTAELDAGNLRHIRFGGIEIIRAVSFIVRDRNWGTYNPVISDLSIVEETGGFTVTYNAIASDSLQVFRYSAQIEGSADGRLSFTATGTAETDFLTNRTGFVVLHPIKGVAGQPVTIEHVNGDVVRGQFPDLIDPIQPMMDLRALTHEASPGLHVTCRMEGDTFEMEDQRNWTDASYKTYVRPLALPWPYTLTAGQTIEQAVYVQLAGEVEPDREADETVIFQIGEPLGPVPPLGLGYSPETDAAADNYSATLRALGTHHLICHYDPRLGHDHTTLAAAVSTARALGTKPWLEAVLTEIAGVEREIAELGALVQAMGSPFAAILLSPAPDLKCTLPGSVWPPAPDAETVFRSARKAFPNTRIGGGMFSLFTEMNRKRPPVELIDFVSFTTTAVLHAGDDHSVMEGLEALPAVARSAKAIARDRPFAVGPSAIGLRMNPYGDAPMQNPANIRQAMNFNDPRQRGLLGAAWAVAYFAQFASNGAQAITLGGTVGAFGVLHSPQPWPQPWFDDHGGLFPMFHALRALASLAGQPMHAISISAPEHVQAIAAESSEGLVILAANLTALPRTVSCPGALHDIFILDAESFVEASQDTNAIEHMTRVATGTRVELQPYAVARMRLAQ